MPIAPSAHTYQCPACEWSHTVAPRSDALRPGEHFSSCPKCGCTHLVVAPASAVRQVLATVLRGVRIRLG